MAKRLTPEMNRSVSFTYNNTKITLGPFLWNPYFECWIMGYTDSSGVSIKSIPVRAEQTSCRITTQRFQHCLRLTQQIFTQTQQSILILTSM